MRDRAWRRAKDATKELKQKKLEKIRSERRIGSASWSRYEPSQKNWKHMYTRSEKTSRARKLGFDYPRKTQRTVLEEHDTE